MMGERGPPVGKSWRETGGDGKRGRHPGRGSIVVTSWSRCQLFFIISSSTSYCLFFETPAVTVSWTSFTTIPRTISKYHLSPLSAALLVRRPSLSCECPAGVNYQLFHPCSTSVVLVTFAWVTENFLRNGRDKRMAGLVKKKKKVCMCVCV